MNADDHMHHDIVPNLMEPSEAQEPAAAPYRVPQLFVLGTAVEVLRSNSQGNASDSQNWYVYP